MDFYFPDKGKAARFISFLENVCPVKVKTSKKLIGTDDKSNIANFKYTSLVEICPLCKDDLLYLPAKMARNMGNISRLVLVKNVSNVIHLIDPLSGQIASMSPEVFWREPIRPLITAARSRMTRYIVLSKEPVFLRQNVAKRKTNRKQKSRLASVAMAREDDLGVNDNSCEERSHVGYLLKAGDVCLGYDLKETQFVDDEAESTRSQGKLPDAIVVRKLYGDPTCGSAVASKRRIWRLQRLDVDTKEIDSPKSRRGTAAAAAADADDMDEEDFMQEVEADRDMRSGINLYKSELASKKKHQEGDEVEKGSPGGRDIVDDDDDDDNDDEDDQKVTLEELLDDLALDDGPDNQTDGEEGNVSASMILEGEKASKDGISFVTRDDARRGRQRCGHSSYRSKA